MNDAVVNGIFALAGVTLGWILNWWTGQRQVQKREAQIRQDVRLLLELECTKNLSALFEYWGKVSSDRVYIPGVGELVNVGASNDEGTFNKRQRLAREPLPAWGHLMWDGQVSRLAAALGRTNIDRLSTLYADLETFTKRRAEIRGMLDTPEGQQLAADYGDWMQKKQGGHPAPGTSQDEIELEATLHRFNVETITLWSECEAIYGRWLPYEGKTLIEEDPPTQKWSDQPKRWVRRASKVRLRIES
jgi:hypothetical protein